MFDALPAGRLHIVALCEWMAREVRRSPLLGRFPVSVIPNGLDTEVFAPRDRRAAREQLGLPVDGRLALFVAESVKNRRKGFQLLLDALRGLNLEDGITLLSIGRSPPELSLGCGHKHLGEIHDDATLAAAYSAADVFVLPSLQDNLPNTALESLACGTPVVAFDTGGIPDIVRPGLTGALAPVGDPAALRKAITSLLGDSDALARMWAHCREVAVKEYALEVQTKRYAALYEKLLGQGG
jgi:glycosyltransferase involved in cell wall biosynthesis